jgi:hypothetical protein
MKIQLFEKKYRKTKDHDGTVEIQLNHLVQARLVNEAYSVQTIYKRDDNGRTIGEETTKTLNVKAIQKKIPQCVKIKIGDLYIKL